jgi:1,2-diacylglycerol 3-beta-galactosyltransferase
LGGPRASWPLRRLTGLYGPAIRLAPWAWGAVYHGSNSRAVLGILSRTVLASARRPVLAAVATHRPAVVVSCHPLTGRAALRLGVPVVNVVTDLATRHRAWRSAADHTIVAASDGLPVGRAFLAGPATTAERAALRESLGLRPDRFVAVLTGGGEGSGGLARRATALSRLDVDVVVLCGRNARLRRQLAAVPDDRLTVLGFVTNVADWLRCADVVVGKAGPGTIAEAACCGAPLLLTSHVPGQERGNTELVVSAGAGLPARSVRELVRHVDRLRHDPAALTEMRAAAARLGRPAAATDAATVIAGLAKEANHGVSA